MDALGRTSGASMRSRSLLPIRKHLLWFGERWDYGRRPQRNLSLSWIASLFAFQRRPKDSCCRANTGQLAYSQSGGGLGVLLGWGIPTLPSGYPKSSRSTLLVDYQGLMKLKNFQLLLRSTWDSWGLRRISFCLHFFVDPEGRKLRIHNEPPGHIGDGESNNQKIATPKKISENGNWCDEIVSSYL